MNNYHNFKRLYYFIKKRQNKNIKIKNKYYYFYKILSLLFIIDNILLILYKFIDKYEKYENFLKYCNKSTLLKIMHKQIPKISIISPIYNREKYILRFLISIQSQNFKEIEIILIDDFSLDNSSALIEKYKKKDERIILIKNKKNKGTFICRNIGALYSKGQYIILPDPDDIITEEILKYLYNYSVKYKYEMIRFNMYIGNKRVFNNNFNSLKKRAIFQPELSTYLFHGKKRLQLLDFNVCNKFIKREAYIRAIYNIPKFCINQYMIIVEDQIMNYILYRVVKSFIFINKIGYYYIKNKQSVTINIQKISEQRLKSWFIYLKIVFHISKSNQYEKIMANELLNIFINKFNFKHNLEFFKKEKIFYNDIIKLYIDCKYITNKNKIILKNLMNIIL